MADGSPRTGLSDRVQSLVIERLGPGSELRSLVEMPDGHAGLTYGLTVAPSGAAGADTTLELVLKMAPAGVPLRGATDIYRQAPLLAALHEAGLHVPAVPWSEPGDQALGAPFIVMQRLPGRTFIIWDPHPALELADSALASMWTQAAQAMAGIHRFAWRGPLADWQEPVTLLGELRRWTTLYRHCDDAEWLALSLRLERELRATLPAESAIGLLHGDFQPGNVLYDGGRLTGIIDWDLAEIGPVGMDVGWLMMMADRRFWAPGWRPRCPLAPADLMDAYLASGGPTVEGGPWYQAFAHFRLGAIAGLNLKLHRDGRRRDAVWERFAPSIPLLLAGGLSLIEEMTERGSS